MFPRCALGSFFASLLLATALAAQEPAASPDSQGALAAQRWSDLTVRDRRISFSSRSASDARAFLALPGAVAGAPPREAFEPPGIARERASAAPTTEAPAPASKSPELRGAAWIALGSSGAVGERLVLEDLALHGEGVERKAALLALGELATSSDAFFTAQLGEPDGLADCALLALLRTGRAAARQRVEQIAHDESHALNASAATLLVFQADPAASGEHPAARLLLDLRWKAACRFGLVDGQSWNECLIQRLARDERFRRDLVLRGCLRLYRPGVRDHLLQILLAGQGTERVRAALGVLPLEVQALVENELWLPADAAEWRTLLDTIEERGIEGLCSTLIERAGREPGLHDRAAILAARGRKLELATWIDPELTRLPVERRIAACDALAESGDIGWRARLEELEQASEPAVRLSAHVARMRLGSRPAEEDLKATLEDTQAADHAGVLAALVRVARDPHVGNLLEDYLPRAQPDEELDIALALCREGRVTARSRVRRALAAEPPPSGALALQLIRALCRRPGPEDLIVLRALFPFEGGRAANLELAAALLELGDPECEPILRAALWGSELDLGALAGAVLIEVGGGLRVLRTELRAPPPAATSADLRRVGFAIGEWGGLREVEDLARELRYASGEPALQGALMGALAARTQ